MVFHVSRPLHRLGIQIAFELLEDLAVGLADDVGQDVEPAPVGHAHDRLVEALADGRFEDRVEDDDGRLGTFEAEPLLADVAGVEESLEDLGGIEAIQDVPLLLGGDHGGHTFDMLLDPALLLDVLDVHVLDAEGPAVRVAQQVEDLVQGGGVLAGETVGHERPGQVPDGQSVVERVELGMELRRHGVQRIEVGDQMATDPVHVDEGLDVGLLDQTGVPAVRAVGRRIVVALPPDRLVGDLERGEDLVVEAVTLL